MAQIHTHITRGNIIESTHKSKCVIKNYNYKTIFSTKNNKDLVYPRSAIKILQAIPFIQSQAKNKYNLTQKQIAICCSSHCGEEEHINVLKEWIKKTKIKINHLKCGFHNPINLKSSNKILLNGIKPNQLHNNCAGKQLGMISGCKASNLNTINYLNINHPYQIKIRKCLEDFTECKVKKIQRDL